MYNNFNNFGSSSFGQSSQGGGSQYQGFQKQYQPVGYVQSFYGANAAQGHQGWGTQGASSASYHTSQYRGNQTGHDNSLRSDSQHPSQHQTSFASYSGMNQAQNQFGSNQPQFGQQSQQQYGQQHQPYSSNQFGRAVTGNQSYGQQWVSPTAYHTSQYRGNQSGHDNYQRSDSMHPAQHQTGSFQSGIGGQSFSSFSTGLNQVGQQFGFNSAY